MFCRLFDRIDRLLIYYRLPNIEITVPKEPESVDLDVAAIAGAVVGGVSAVLLIVLGVYLYLRRRRKQKRDLAEKVPVPLPVGGHRRIGGLLTTPTPFLAENLVSTLNESSKTSKWNTIAHSKTTEEGLVIAMTSGSRGYPPLSSRAQEAGLHSVLMPHLHPTRPPHLRDGLSSQSPDTLSSIYTGILPETTVDLRTEVELLRREMEELRRQRTSVVVEETPPTYSGGDETLDQRI